MDRGFLVVAVLALIPIAFIMTHKFAFCVFYLKQGEKMHMAIGLYIVSIIIYTYLIILFSNMRIPEVIPYFIVYDGILVFLAVTATILERLCRELSLIKSQLSEILKEFP